jgi:hypothetical protein
LVVDMGRQPYLLVLEQQILVVLVVVVLKMLHPVGALLAKVIVVVTVLGLDILVEVAVEGPLQWVAMLVAVLVVMVVMGLHILFMT